MFLKLKILSTWKFKSFYEITRQIFLVISYGLFLSFNSIAAEQMRDYPLSKISTNTYVIHGPLGYPSVENQGFMNNPAFVITREGVVVIDPGSSLQTGRMFLKQMRTVTDKPVTHVFNTHVHGDHWLANQAIIEAFPNAKLIGHPEMIRLISAGEGEHWVKLMDESTNGFTKGTKSVPPTIASNDGDTYKIGGATFRIYAPEKAHSHSDIMIEAVEESVIFTGDNVLNKTIARMVDGTFKGNIAACDKIAMVNAKHYVPGHGPTGDVTVVTNFRNYLATVYENVQKQYSLGKADFEMKDTIIAQLNSYQSWNRFELEVGKHIGLSVLEIEASF
jgi:glyoxylase-like metal-dependent hydrolase (beta-lactamase superfamily II)